jgi:hypothetical protein
VLVTQLGGALNSNRFAASRISVSSLAIISGDLFRIVVTSSSGSGMGTAT